MSLVLKKNLLLFKKEFKVVIFSLATPFVHTKMITGPEKNVLVKRIFGKGIIFFCDLYNIGMISKSYCTNCRDTFLGGFQGGAATYSVSSKCIE